MSYLPPDSSFYEHLPFGILVVAQDRHKLEVLYANDRMKHWLGQSAPEGLAFSTVWGAHSTHDTTKALTIAKALTGTTPPKSAKLPLGKRWIKFHVQSVQWPSYPERLPTESRRGETTRDAYILWGEDISHDQNDHAALEKSLAQADAVAEMKSNFLATMSHEMRTPMQSVYGLLELMELENPPPALLDMLRMAKSSSIGLLQILDDILDLAKIDADKMDLDTFEVPVRTLVTGIIEALAVKAHAKDLSLTCTIDEAVPAVILGDPKRLRQILINLAGNALKFTDKGHVHIRVTPQATALPAPQSGHLNLRFEVVDTGIGMDATTQNRLFQSFTQADTSTARKFGGTGLGLSISKKLVELMGGKIGVSSAPGTGSTFWFEIPTQSVGITTSELILPDLTGISVLSVEDHPQGAQEIINSLRSMGATVEGCGTVHEARHLITRRPYDVAIIDQSLPDGDGLSLTRQILHIRPTTGLIMYTARDDAGLQHSLASLGVPYLGKPASRLGLGQATLAATRQRPPLPLHDQSNRILVAEDTPSIRDLLARQLSKIGVCADFVSNGIEALDALRRVSYDLLISDLHMPQMDGYALCETIRAQEQQSKADRLPIIVLTADVQIAQRQIYMAHGFDECLLKPVSLGHLRRLLIRWGFPAAVTDPSSEMPTSKQTDLLHPPSSTNPAADTLVDTLGAAIDQAALLRQMGALDESAIEMLAHFADMTRPVLLALTKAAAENDAPAVREAAHSLKGAARSAAALHLGDLCAQAQALAEGGIVSLPIITDITHEFDRATDEVRQLKPV